MAAMHLTSSNFDQEVLNSTIPYSWIWGPGAGPAVWWPIVEQIADEYERIKVGKVNVDRSRTLRTLWVMSIPTLLMSRTERCRQDRRCPAVLLR